MRMESAITTADNGELSPLPPARPGAPGSCHWPFKLTTKMPNRPGDQPSPQSHPKRHSEPRADAQTTSSSLPVFLSNAQLRTSLPPGSTSPFPSPSSPPRAPTHHHHRQPMNPSLCYRVRGQLSLGGGGASEPRAPGHCYRQSSPQGAWECAQAQLSQAVTPRNRKQRRSRPHPRRCAPSRVRKEARQPRAALAQQVRTEPSPLKETGPLT